MQLDSPKIQREKRGKVGEYMLKLGDNIFL